MRAKYIAFNFFLVIKMVLLFWVLYDANTCRKLYADLILLVLMGGMFSYCLYLLWFKKEILSAIDAMFPLFGHQTLVVQGYFGWIFTVAGLLLLCY